MFLQQLKAKAAQSCQTLCDPVDYTVHGSLQARILEWVAVPFSRGSSQPRDWTQVSHIVGGFFTSWTIRWLIQRILEWVAYPFSSGSSWGLLHHRQILYQVAQLQYPLQYSGLEKFHGQRSLAGYSPWGHKESDATEQLSLSPLKLFVEHQLYIRLGARYGIVTQIRRDDLVFMWCNLINRRDDKQIYNNHILW